MKMVLEAKEKKHLKLLLSPSGKQFEAILFGGSSATVKTDDIIDIVYRIGRDDWNGNSKIQLRISDLTPSGI
jgi:hypothetical protein